MMRIIESLTTREKALVVSLLGAVSLSAFLFWEPLKSRFMANPSSPDRIEGRSDSIASSVLFPEMETREAQTKMELYRREELGEEEGMAPVFFGGNEEATGEQDAADRYVHSTLDAEADAARARRARPPDSGKKPPDRPQKSKSPGPGGPKPSKSGQQKETFSFYTVTKSEKAGKTPEAERGVPAVVHNRQVVERGNRLRVRLTGTLTLPSMTLSANTILYGDVGFTSDRVTVTFPSMVMGNKVVQLDLQAYGLDGSAGFPYSSFPEGEKILNRQVRQGVDNATRFTPLNDIFNYAAESATRPDRKVTLPENFRMILK